MKSFIIFLILMMSINVYGLKVYNPENAVSSGTGGAYNAALNNPEVMFYNPANFYDIKKNFMNISYNKYFANLNSETGLDSSSGYYSVDIASYNIAYIFPAGKFGGAGVYYYSMNFKDLQKVNVLGIGICANLSRYIKLYRDVSVGVIGKYIVNGYEQNSYNTSFFDENPTSVSGYSFDMGTFIKINPALQVGISGLNIIATSFGSKYDDAVLPEYRIGILYSMYISLIGQNKFNILSDFSYSGADYNFFIGGELLVKSFKVRMGVNFNYADIGFEYEYNHFVGADYTINYMFSGISGFGLNHKMGLFVKF